MDKNPDFEMILIHPTHQALSVQILPQIYYNHEIFHQACLRQSPLEPIMNLFMNLFQYGLKESYQYSKQPNNNHNSNNNTSKTVVQLRQSYCWEPPSTTKRAHNCMILWIEKLSWVGVETSWHWIKEEIGISWGYGSKYVLGLLLWRNNFSFLCCF